MTSSSTVGVSDGASARTGRRSALVVACSPSPSSISTGASDMLANALTEAGLDVARVRVLELPLVAAGLDDEDYPDAIVSLIEAAKAASIIGIAGPVYRSAVSGVTRNTLELLRAGLEHTVVIPVLAAGSARSHLALSSLRADLFINFSAKPTSGVLVTDDLDTDERIARVRADVAAALDAVAGVS